VKSGQREREITHAARRDETSVFFESPHRLQKTLEVCARLCPERVLCVARELTKTFEEYRIGTGAELGAHYTAHPAKGEIVFLMRAKTKEERAASALGSTAHAQPLPH
jgi:16S rRNA (cytidine1402-2'-O)-methyltransferase